ncbi:hypothetical protein EON63_00805 [archaeon]|nr:MAG: hypothetical protein EON63_00805 [archaeon]
MYICRIALLVSLPVCLPPHLIKLLCVFTSLKKCLLLVKWMTRIPTIYILSYCLAWCIISLY